MDPISKEQILLLYRDQLDNIRDLKSNQWKISHYGLIAQAAIFSVYNLSKVSSCPITYGFVLLSFSVSGLCIWVINQMQRMIAKRREALVYLSDELTKTFSDVRKNCVVIGGRRPLNADGEMSFYMDCCYMLHRALVLAP